MKKQLEYAKKIALFSFADKKDLSGRSYFGHLQRVAESVEYPRAEIIAYLHDLLEDCPEWNEDSLRCFFEEGIINSVVALTKSKDENYEKYIERVMADPYAVDVKIADLEDNMDVKRLNHITDKDVARLKKYHKAWKKLKEKQT